MGDRERDVGRREEVGIRTRSQDQQGPGQEGRASGWTCLGGASQVGALGIGAEGRGDAEAERTGLNAEAVELEPGAEELEPA